ncbi:MULTISPECIES: hypothetical protein [Sphingomonas]|uniref:Uncharacterized protein n=1 Tax=Sphingomonas hankookensis TaxID=563996 RepID=A0ABR5Y8B5_9SPHN|nr:MULTISPECIES: hypothetical protein [Sphingomonas]KZE09128.1 hypothetical protein AVT10_06675 [Sphingomonas hankookensis]PZT95558.1 MAG: hypothetical protein DI625_02135 [Sphingomonas sp.]
MRGEVPFEALGGRWTLFIGTAAQCALEQEHDKGFFAILQDAMPSVGLGDVEDKAKMAKAARDLRIGTLRSFALHGLAKYHCGLTVDQVDEIIDDLGFKRFGEIIGTAIAAAADRVTEEGEKAPGKPRTRTRRPTGKH